MANFYVYSGATGTGTGASWTDACTTLQVAVDAAVAGDDIWVASDHYESLTGTTTTLTFPGGMTNPNRCISVNRAGSVPPVAADIQAGAIVETTGATAITINNAVYIYGITFNCSTGSSIVNFSAQGASNNRTIFHDCAINLLNTATTGRITLGGQSNSSVELINTTLQFSHASQSISGSGTILWRDTDGQAAVQGATVPTVLFSGLTSNNSTITLSGLDFTSLGSNKLFGGVAQRVTVINCKLGSGGGVSSGGVPGVASQGIMMINCSDSSSVKRNELFKQQGSLTTETTIVRTAGASDGVTPYSWKISASSNARVINPLDTFEGIIWNDTTGSSKTLTFHCVTDNVTLTNADIYAEVEYLGSSGSPLGALATSGPATVLTTGTNLTSASGEAWTTTGLTTPNKQKFSVSFTPQLAGPVRWRVRVTKGNSTIYLCPKPDIT